MLSRYLSPALSFCITAATLLAAAPSVSAQGFSSVRLITGISRPVFLSSPPNDPSNRLFVLEQHTGRVEVFDRDGSFLGLFIDVGVVATFNEAGLLGMAFHPDYLSNGRFFLSYVLPGGNGTSVLREYSVNGDPATSNVANAGIVATLFAVPQPFTNHNGGCIQFGLDGMLYMGMGDGGSANDPGNRAQNLTNLMGKMLRFDVDNGPSYIPSDNPYLGAPNDPGNTIPDQIWAYGLRNPWRFSFDAVLGHLYIGDVGQFAREEWDFQPVTSTGTENYGWRCMEGFNCTGLSGCTCNGAALTLPVQDYPRNAGRCSIIGGIVYRGEAIPNLHGTYFYADYCSAQVWSVVYDGINTSNFVERTAQLVPPLGSINSITSFGTDAEGEVYILDQGGEVFKIVQTCVNPLDCAESFCDDLDGSLASCPCSNPGNPDSGCDNAQGTGGVKLAVTVLNTVVSTGTMVATGFPPASTPTAVVIRGNKREATPVTFFDGLRCVGLKGFVRFGAASAVGGTSTHAINHGAGSGTFFYQLWYRNTPTTFCDVTAAANTSNGQSLTW